VKRDLGILERLWSLRGEMREEVAPVPAKGLVIAIDEDALGD
jgi:hypothetical protein